MTPDVHYARNRDASLAYQVVGDGPRDILLVSGFLSNLEYAWMYPSPSAFPARVSGLSRLGMMGRRGAGLSDRFTEAPAAETMLDDLEVVLDEVGAART